MLVSANLAVEPLSKQMPLLLAPEGHAAWLDGCSPLSLGSGFEETCFYRENLAERWSTGRQVEGEPPLFRMTA